VEAYVGVALPFFLRITPSAQWYLSLANAFAGGAFFTFGALPPVSLIRSAAQMVSYEVSVGLLIPTVRLSVGSFLLPDDIILAQQKFGSVSANHHAQRISDDGRALTCTLSTLLRRVRIPVRTHVLPAAMLTESGSAAWP